MFRYLTSNLKDEHIQYSLPWILWPPCVSCIHRHPTRSLLPLCKNPLICILKLSFPLQVHGLAHNAGKLGSYSTSKGPSADKPKTCKCNCFLFLKSKRSKYQMHKQMLILNEICIFYLICCKDDKLVKYLHVISKGKVSQWEIFETM